MEQTLIVAGLVLFLLGLLTGIIAPKLTNPRMGVSSHIQGMTNGPFLILVGVLWPQVNLPHAWGVATVVLLVFGAFANWLAMQLGAVWGAGHRYAPGVAGAHRASRAKEQTVTWLLIALTPAMIIGTVLLIVGVLR